MPTHPRPEHIRDPRPLQTAHDSAIAHARTSAQRRARDEWECHVDAGRIGAGGTGVEADRPSPTSLRAIDDWHRVMGLPPLKRLAIDR